MWLHYDVILLALKYYVHHHVQDVMSSNVLQTQYMYDFEIQWNPSNVDNLGTWSSVLFREASSLQG